MLAILAQLLIIWEILGNDFFVMRESLPEKQHLHCGKKRLRLLIDYSLPMSSFPPVLMRSRRFGFTVIELLVVVSIVTLLASLLLPSLRRMQESARSTGCLSNLRQIGVAMAAFVFDNNGYLPNSQVADGKDATSPDAKGEVSWIQRVWPYAYPDRDFKGFGSAPELPKELSRTIFECRQAAFDKNVTIKRSYGYNHYAGDDFVLGGDKMNSFRRPGQVCVVADVKSASQLHRTTINPRHSNASNVLYMDGHVAPIILTAAITDDVSYRDPFWGRTKFQ